jgi:hypothetical protein
MLRSTEKALAIGGSEIEKPNSKRMFSKEASSISVLIASNDPPERSNFKFSVLK